MLMRCTTARTLPTSTRSSASGPNHSTFQLTSYTRQQITPKQQPQRQSRAFAAASAHDALTSPAVRYYLSLYNLDPQSIQGSGKKGRILKGDILDFVQKGGKQAQPRPTTPSPAAKETTPQPPAYKPLAQPPKAPSIPASGPFSEIPNPLPLKSLASTFQQSKFSVPHLYMNAQVNMDELLTIQQKYTTQKLQLQDFLARAVALALRDVPELNATWVEQDTANPLKQQRAIDVTIVNSKNTTATIRNADQKGVAVISEEAQSSDNTSSSQVGTFSVVASSELESFIEIVKPPQTGIVALGKPQKSVIPDPVTNQPKIVRQSHISLSVDQRVADEDTAGRFLDAVVGYLSTPHSIVLKH